MSKTSTLPAIARVLSALAAFVFLGIWSAPAEAGAASPYRVLHQFCEDRCNEGALPTVDQLVLDVSGKLYGTTSVEGPHGQGTIYDVFPKNGGASYGTQVLRAFCTAPNHCKADGRTSAGVIMDTAGNLYGTTPLGQTACGVVYEAVLSAGKYHFKALHEFASSGGDGCRPTAAALSYHGKETGQLYDGTSPLFGVTNAGGANSRGALFEITPPKPGHTKWRERIIYSNCEIFGCADGHDPVGNVIMDGAGNLYTTAHQATGDIVLQLQPDGSGGYFKVPVYKSAAQDVYSFLRIAADGTLYGASGSGGPTGHGSLFKLVPDGSGGFNYTDLHDFCPGGDGTCTDGDEAGPTLMDSSGNIFGVTLGGGSNPAPAGSPFTGAGVIYEYSSGGSFTVVHNFCNETNCTDGSTPSSGLVTDGGGNFFGTTELGGASSFLPADSLAQTPAKNSPRGKAPIPPPPPGSGVLYELSLP